MNEIKNMNDWKRPEGDGGKFEIDLLHALELDMIKKTSKKSEAWLKKLWKWLLLAFAFRWTSKTFNDFMQQSKFSLGDELDSHTKRVAEIAIRQAEKDVNTGHRTSLEDRKLILDTITLSGISSTLKLLQWANSFRDDIRWQISEGMREGITKEQLSKRLEERWEKHGQHFTQIVVTEINTMFNSSYLLELPEYSYVTVPPIRDNKVCKYCKNLLEGRVFKVLHTAPNNPTKEELETCVWPGKSNVGLTPNKYVPTIPMHGNCRHYYKFIAENEIKKGWVSAHTRGSSIHVKRYWRDNEKGIGTGTWEELGLPNWKEIAKIIKPIEIPYWYEKYSYEAMQDFVERSVKHGYIIPDKSKTKALIKTADNDLVRIDSNFMFHITKDGKPQKGEEDRTKYLVGIYAALKNPLEIWRQPVSKSKQLGRCYLSIVSYDDNGKKYTYKMIVRERDGDIVGWTAQQMSDPKDANKYRHGTLLYKDY